MERGGAFIKHKQNLISQIENDSRSVSSEPVARGVLETPNTDFRGYRNPVFNYRGKVGRNLSAIAIDVENRRYEEISYALFVSTRAINSTRQDVNRFEMAND